MKSISSAIIVLAASILIAMGGFIQHGDSKVFVQFVGCIIAVIGLAGWYFSITSSEG